MNGRGYDYNSGRFLSIDPFIQDPGNSQSINAYAYIMNNPLSGTDPTGYAAVKQKVTGSHIKRDPTKTSNVGGQITVGGSKLVTSFGSSKSTSSESLPDNGGKGNSGGALQASGDGAGPDITAIGSSNGEVDSEVPESSLNSTAVVLESYESSYEALNAAIDMVLSEDMEEFRLSGGEISTSIEELEDGRFAVSPLEQHPCRSNRDQCTASIQATLRTIYIIHTHPEGFDLGPSNCSGCDFDALEKANRARPRSRERPFRAVLVNSKGVAIQYWQTTRDKPPSFFSSKKRYRKSRVIREQSNDK